MRTLTLGVLIVSGGTLAALPFRKYQAIPDASSAPVQVTGPMRSALDTADNRRLATHDSYADESSSDRIDERFVVLDTSVVAPIPPQRHSSVPVVSPRTAEILLTYDELAMPIDAPPPIAQRFNATVPIRQQQLQQERVSALVMPAMEQLAATQQLELQRVAESIRTFSDQRNEPKAAGSLASSRDRTVERLPKAAPVERDRHWIRQPE